MVNKVDGEGQEKLPPPGEKIQQVPEDIQISKVTKDEGIPIGEGVREVQEGMGGVPEGFTTEVDTFDADKLFEEILRNSEELQRLVEAAQVDPQTAPSLNTWAEQHSEELLEIAKMHAEAAEDWGRFMGGALLIPGTILETGEKYFSKPLEKHVIPLMDVNEIVKQVGEGVAEAEFIFQVPVTLGKGASLIYKRTVLKMVERQMLLEEEKLAKAPDEKRQMELNELKAWLKVQNDFLFSEAKEFGFDTLTHVPHAIEQIAGLVGDVSETFEVATFGVLAFVTVAAKGYTVHVARKKITTQKEWMERFKEKPIVDEPITSTIKVELKDGKRKVYEVPVAPKEMTDAIGGLLEKRKKAVETRMALSKEEFEAWAIPCANSIKEFEEVKGEFKKKGVDLDTLKEPVKSKGELREALTNPEKEEVKKEMLQQYVEKKQTISVLVRNGLKGLAEKKNKIERKFLNFKLTKSSISLALSTLAFAAILTLKILAVVAIIAIPSAAFGYAGIGVFVIGIALMVIGLIVLYYYKPNLCNQLIRGVQLRIALNNIPHTFHNFRLNLVKVKRLKKDLELSKMSSRIVRLRGLMETRKIQETKKIPKELRPLIKKFNFDIDESLRSKDYDKILQELLKLEKEEKARIDQEQKKLDAKIADIEKTVKKWQDKITPLRQKLINAGWKDFERMAKLRKTAPKTVEGKEVPQKDFGLDDVLVEGLLHDENYLDPQTRKILKEQLGIDLDKIRKSNEQEKKKIEEETKLALKSFFAMDDTALIKFIKKQQAKFDFGVLGGTAE